MCGMCGGEPGEFCSGLIGGDSNAVLSTGGEAFAEGPKILPTEAGTERLTGAAIPKDRAGALSSNAYTIDRSNSCDHEPGHFEGDVSEGERIKLYETRCRARGRKRALFYMS
jgi:hypothetical protein